MFKKVLLIVGAALVILSSFNGATALQILPFAILGILAYFEMYQKVRLNLWIVVLSVLMAIINLGLLSWPDIIFWVLAGAAFWKEDKAR